MSARTVTSLSNPTVKAVRALHMRKERDETGLFVAEGLKNVIEGIDTGHAPKILMHGSDAADHPMMRKAVQATLAARGEVLEVTQDILAKVSRRENPQAVVGVFPQAFQALDDVGFTVPAQSVTYWVGEAMQAVDYKDVSPTPDTTAGTTQVLARHAAHLARLLRTAPYPAGD